jgi:opacity protein-like surface antigen
MNLKKLVMFLLVPVFSLSMIFNQSAYAELYLGGAVGIAIPHNVDNLDVSGSGFSVDISSFSPETAFTGGIKGGYFFESIPYLGVEINWSMSAPDVDKEAITATITGTPTGALVGRSSGDLLLGSVDVDSYSSFGFLTMLRVTDEDANKNYFGMQPFLGLGFTISTLDVNSATIFDRAGTQLGTTGNSDSSTDVGFLLSTGLNYIVSDNIKVYSEYKFQTVKHTLTMDTGVDSKLTAESSSVVFGASYSF